MLIGFDVIRSVLLTVLHSGIAYILLCISSINIGQARVVFGELHANYFCSVSPPLQLSEESATATGLTASVGSPVTVADDLQSAEAAFRAR